MPDSTEMIGTTPRLRSIKNIHILIHGLNLGCAIMADAVELEEDSCVTGVALDTRSKIFGFYQRTNFRSNSNLTLMQEVTAQPNYPTSQF
jgi:hypothetical protein